MTTVAIETGSLVLKYVLMQYETYVGCHKIYFVIDTRSTGVLFLFLFELFLLAVKALNYFCFVAIQNQGVCYEEYILQF